MPIGRDDYEERKERRIDRLTEKAEQAAAASLAAYERSRKIGEGIPFGQPILVGHHSEKGHRADARRIEAAMDKSVAEGKKADYYQDRANAAAKNQAISGDDPGALKRYREKLENLEKVQEVMKAANRAWKAGKGAEGLKAAGLNEKQIAGILENLKRFPYEKAPFPAYALSNNNAEIRRIKEKMEALAELDGMEAEIVKFSGGEMRVDVEINRVQFFFDDIPPPGNQGASQVPRVQVGPLGGSLAAPADGERRPDGQIPDTRN
jgi:hypothetical protein